MKLQNMNAFQLVKSDAINEDAKNWAFQNWRYLTKVDTPLTNIDSSAKLEKGEGYKVAILYLKPSDMITTETICPAAKLFGCEEDCLEGSGQLGMKTGDNAKIKRTILFALDREAFEKELSRELEKHYKKYGDQLRVRLNGTSDINWYSVIAMHSHIKFYDYSKIFFRVKNNKLKNYHLTFSGSANNTRTIKQTAKAINNNMNTVLAINTKELKSEYKRPTDLNLIPLVDMDKDDYRFLDKAGSVGTLKRKGSSKSDRAEDEKRNNFFFNQTTIEQLKGYLNQSSVIQ